MGKYWRAQVNNSKTSQPGHGDDVSKEYFLQCHPVRSQNHPNMCAPPSACSYHHEKKKSRGEGKEYVSACLSKKGKWKIYWWGQDKEHEVGIYKGLLLSLKPEVSFPSVIVAAPITLSLHLQ